MPHRATIEQFEQLSYNVRRYLLGRPEGYEFVAGQATEVALDRDGWRDKKRPFTFAGLAEQPQLEFIIKSYPDHGGVTEQIGQANVGDSLLLDDPWETLHLNGAGTFIAGGAGITPFLAVLRQWKKDKKLAGCRLIFSNSTARDVFLEDELKEMDGLELILTLTGEQVPGYVYGKIDRGFLQEHAGRFEGNFYLCGPVKMQDELKHVLLALGASGEKIFIAD